MDRLRQALDDCMFGVTADDIDRHLSATDHLALVVDAARLVVEGEPIWWCETHRASSTRRLAGLCGERDPDDNSTCRMVGRLLTEVPQ